MIIVRTKNVGRRGVKVTLPFKGEVITPAIYNFVKTNKRVCEITDNKKFFYDNREIFLEHYKWIKEDPDNTLHHENPMVYFCSPEVAREILWSGEERKRPPTLAEKLMEFYKDYDTYGFYEAMEKGDTEEDVIRRIDEDLHSTQYVLDTIDQLKRIRDYADLSQLQMREVEGLLGELSGKPILFGLSL